MANVFPAQRLPNWPIAWLELAAKVGSSVKMRESLFYKAKSSLTNKITGHSCWTTSDVFLLNCLCKEHGVAIETLLTRDVLDRVKAEGRAWGQSPGPWQGEPPKPYRLPSSHNPVF